MSKAEKKKVLVVERYPSSYYGPFACFGPQSNDLSLLDKNPESIALVVFTGGEDVSPSIYGEEAHKYTYTNPQRDAIEIEVFDKAVKLKLPIAGICRGSQFICAKSGGKLAQHITGHGRYHNLVTDDGRTIYVSSTHHQMQLPPENALVLAWSEEKLSAKYEGPNGVLYTPEKEYDCVYYPNTHALGMQYHPEYMDKNTAGFQYCAELCRRCLGLRDAD